MDFRYLPATEADKTQMLEKIGAKSTDELFSDIPEKVRLDRKLNLKEPTSEYELKKEMTAMAAKNANLQDYSSFLGAGVYDHFIPSVVDHVISRQDFYTSCRPIVTSSLYVCGNAVVQAMYLSNVQTKKNKILISKAIHTEYSQ